MILFIPHNKPVIQGLCLHSYKKTEVQSSLKRVHEAMELPNGACRGLETRAASLHTSGRVTYVHSSLGLSGPVNFFPILTWLLWPSVCQTVSQVLSQAGGQSTADLSTVTLPRLASVYPRNPGIRVCLTFVSLSCIYFQIIILFTYKSGPVRVVYKIIWGMKNTYLS